MEKMGSKKILAYAGLALAAFGGYKLIKFVRDNNKGAEQKSNANGQKTTTFTLTNNTDKVQTEYLFDSRSGQDNPNVGISPSIGFFNRELSNKPKKLIKVEFRNIGTSSVEGEEAPADAPAPAPMGADPAAPADPAVPPVPPVEPAPAPAEPAPPPAEPAPADMAAPATPKFNQAEAPFMMICKDASGQASERPYTPMISATQFQSGITTVDMRGTILDGECYMKYTMYPKSKVAIVLFYEDMPLSALLDKRKSNNASGGVGKPAENSEGEVKTEKKSILRRGNKKDLDLVGGAIGLAAVGTVGFLAYKYLTTAKAI